jgi:hypothetical protein
VVIASREYWPLPWYFRGNRWDRIEFYRSMKDFDTLMQKKPDVIIFSDTESYPSIPGYQKRHYRHYYWFSLSDNLDRLPAYYLLRDGKTGSTGFDVFTRERVPGEA